VKRVIVIIPAYNEAASIAGVVKQAQEALNEAEILVINDGSADATGQLAAKQGARVINLPYNLGIGGAIQTGYKYAQKNGFQIAVQLDGDGQHDPYQVKMLVDKIRGEDLDLVIGSRFINKEGYQSTLLRRIGIIYISLIIYLLTKKRILDPTSGFRACNRRAMDYFVRYYAADYPEPESIVNLLRDGLRVGEVPVVMQERSGGTSSIRELGVFYFMIKVSLDMLIGAFKNKKNIGISDD